MVGYVYVLHFDQPLSHARHYIGCTEDLLGRLSTHASGRGAKIISALMKVGIEWRVGALGTATRKEIKCIERETKNQHNSARYCELCTPEANRIRGTIPYPITSIPFIACSTDLRTNRKQPGFCEYYVSGEEDTDYILGGMKTLMQQNRDALGFIPISGVAGIESAARRGQVIYAKMNGVVVGYITYTSTALELKIHQCVVEDAHRGCGIGRHLVERVYDFAKQQCLEVLCAVREDLPANEFWLALGFRKTNCIVHATSHNILNIYSKKWEAK